MLLAISRHGALGQLDLQACALDWWATRRMVFPCCSWQYTAGSSSSFVQHIVFSRERKSSIPLLMQPLGGESKWTTRRSKAIDSNIRGVIHFPRSSTQAALLTSSARGENRAHEVLHLILRSGPLDCSCGVARRCSLGSLVHSEVLAPVQVLGFLRLACLAVLRV